MDGLQKSQYATVEMGFNRRILGEKTVVAGIRASVSQITTFSHFTTFKRSSIAWGHLCDTVRNRRGGGISIVFLIQSVDPRPFNYGLGNPTPTKDSASADNLDILVAMKCRQNLATRAILQR